MAHHKYRKGGVPIATNKPSSNVAIIINSGILILLTLLLANFVALVVHVWYFLPHNGSILLQQPPLLSSSSSLSLSNTLDDRIQLCNNNVTVTTKSTDGRIFQKRTRCSNNINININTEQTSSSSAALQLQHALSSAFQTNDKIVRYDIVPTILDQTNDYYGVVHQLPSIPNRRRMIVDNNNSRQNNNNNNNIPSNAIHNLTYFLESRLRPNEEDRPLYIYNPMVLPLDEKVLNENILSDLNLMNKNKNNNNNDLDEDPAYIGIFRISNFGNCHGPGKGVPETYHNYIGIALLDSNLNIIIQEEDTTSGNGDGRRSEHIDVVIDLNQHLYDIKWHKRDKGVKQYMQDCQLIAVPSSNKDILPSSQKKKKKADQLVLICNEYAMKVRLQRITTTSKTLIGGQENNNMDANAIHIKNTYGSTLQLTAIERPHTIIHGGKNLHYFQGGAIDKSSSGGSGNISTTTAAGKLGYLELWPGGPHEVLNMDFVNYPLPPNAIKSTQDEEPEPSFTTIDKSNSIGRNNNIGPLITRDSGSACCVSIQYEGRQLLLGFSHRKTRRGLGKEAQYNYVSRVYAFEATPPFVIVARSGLFCLGFALSDEARQSDNEQVFGAANDAKLEISGEVFNCPRIHFITGIAEKMGDDMKVIISYGINDCYPRMMEVSKSFLVGLLKPTV